MSQIPPTSHDPRYPIGQWQRPAQLDAPTLVQALVELGDLPQKMQEAVRGLSEEQLETPYREGGWTVRQVVHHVADSHMNMYVRLRLALTEDAPTIRPYEEKEWAELQDGKHAPLELSLNLLESLHARLLMLLRSLTPAEWARTYVHPESGPFRVDYAAHMYAWHSRHHVAHVTALRAAKGW